MKVLLVNTPINRQDTLGKFASIYDDMKMIPTGLAILAAFLRDNGIETRILDQYTECLEMDAVIKMIDAYRPDLIGYSSTTPNYYAAIDFVRHIRKKFPKITSIMGGYHPSICPEETLQNPEIDFVIRDEGEHTLLELCKTLQKGSANFDHILGLSYKSPQGIKHNSRAAVVDVDKLPLPAYDLLPMGLYGSPSYTKFAFPVYQMVASRGCPYNCTYCVNAGMNVSSKYRKRSVKLVVDEMELLADKYGARQIQFWDPIFPLGEKHAIEFCEVLMRRGLHKKIVWNSTTRAELMTEKMAKLMFKSGCKGVGFGIESGVPELLLSVNKKFDLEKARQGCKIAYKAGMVVSSGFIIGFPGETKAMTQQTIDFAKSLHLHYAQFSIMVPYPGTPLYEQVLARGEISAGRGTDYSSFNQSVGLTDLDPVFVPKGRTIAELKNAQRNAYTQFYFRPIMVVRHLPHIKLTRIVGLVKSFLAVCKLSLQKVKDKSPKTA